MFMMFETGGHAHDPTETVILDFGPANIFKMNQGKTTSFLGDILLGFLRTSKIEVLEKMRCVCQKLSFGTLGAPIFAF